MSFSGSSVTLLRPDLTWKAAKARPGGRPDLEWKAARDLLFLLRCRCIVARPRGRADLEWKAPWGVALPFCCSSFGYETEGWTSSSTGSVGLKFWLRNQRVGPRVAPGVSDRCVRGVRCASAAGRIPPPGPSPVTRGSVSAPPGSPGEAFQHPPGHPGGRFSTSSGLWNPAPLGAFPPGPPPVTQGGVSTPTGSPGGALQHLKWPLGPRAAGRIPPQGPPPVTRGGVSAPFGGLGSPEGASLYDADMKIICFFTRIRYFHVSFYQVVI